MHRIPLVSVIAGCVVVGHVVPHLLAPHPATPRPPATLQSLVTADLAADPAAGPAGADPPSLVVPTCRLQPPLTASDREPMLDALRPLVARTDRLYPYLAPDHREFVRRFETCDVDVRDFHDYVLVMTDFGGYWTGARFRKTPHGWIALQTEGGDIR